MPAAMSYRATFSCAGKKLDGRAVTGDRLCSNKKVRCSWSPQEGATGWFAKPYSWWELRLVVCGSAELHQPVSHGVSPV